MESPLHTILFTNNYVVKMSAPMLGIFKQTFGGKIVARNGLFFTICGYEDYL